jgi:hypothetical protein
MFSSSTRRGFANSSTVWNRNLLIPESILPAAIGALPGDAVACHPPCVFLHARLAYLEAASASPAKWEIHAAAVAILNDGSAPSPFAPGRIWVGHQSVTPLNRRMASACAVRFACCFAGSMVLRARAKIRSHVKAPMHPARPHRESLTDSDIQALSRLAGQAPQHFRM